VQLVVRDPLRVIDAPVQSHVETEGEEAHGVGFYERRIRCTTIVLMHISCGLTSTTSPME
jgi:hypothetical protein